LDTDPCPEFNFASQSKEKLLRNIGEYYNRPEFSDIIFIVEGKAFYAHKLILSLLRYLIFFNEIVKSLKPCSLLE
jgi:hypothetical protein